MRTPGITLALTVVMGILAGAPSAANATWTSNGPVATTATAPSFKWTINTASSVAVSCTTNWFTGTLGGPTGPVTGSWNLSAPASGGSGLAFTHTGCTAAGWVFIWSCQPTVELWANSYASPVVAGELRKLLCGVTSPVFPGCALSFVGAGPSQRAMAVGYDNTAAQLTLNATGQTITASWLNCPFINPATGSASATFTNLAGGNLIYTVTSSPKPAIAN